MGTNHFQYLAHSVAEPGDAVRHAFTVDVEDYFMSPEGISDARWSDFPERIEGSVDTLLKLLSEADVRATFFVLGWIAERHPDLVKQIATGGHEVGCHGYWHRAVLDMTPQVFKDDLERSLGLLRELSGQGVTAFRAPMWSLRTDTLWAFEILAACGIRVDSSIYPVRTYLFGQSDAPRTPYELRGVLEFPPMASRIGWWGVPVGGGFSLRCFPLWATRSALKRSARRNLAGLIYVHPWELDPAGPRDLPVPWKQRLIHNAGIRSTERKVRALLGEFEFGTLGECVTSL